MGNVFIPPKPIIPPKKGIIIEKILPPPFLDKIGMVKEIEEDNMPKIGGLIKKAKRGKKNFKSLTHNL